MKHRLLGGLTFAVLLSTSGIPSLGEVHAAGKSQPARYPDRESTVGASDFSSSEIASSGQDSSSAATFPEQNSPASRIFNSALVQNSELTSVQPHVLNDRQAATLFINSIPVLTLLGEELAAAGDSKGLAARDNAAAAEDPVIRANGIAERLAELSISSEAADIKARWDQDQELFVIAWGDSDLVAFNQQTMLAGTTEDPAEDALQAANRLRRLLGNAPPLTEIEGRPEPAVEVSLASSTYTGMASWYGPGFHGRRSASGEVFNQHALTAAHRTLPFGTRVRVTNVRTGQDVVVRINDRGPFGHGRIIDLSAGAAAEIGLQRMGVAQVRLEVLSGQ